MVDRRKRLPPRALPRSHLESRFLRFRMGSSLAAPVRLKPTIQQIPLPDHFPDDTLEVRDAILGNARTILSFRLGVTDAEILAKEFYPEFSVEDLISLPNYNIYLKLMIDGRVFDFPPKVRQSCGHRRDRSVVQVHSDGRCTPCDCGCARQ